jgi:hypothetical protein
VAEQERAERVSREELYDLVWRKPMLHVADRYGVSSNFMARVCQSLDVPRPPRGHWAKLSHGKPSPKPSLPDAGPGVGLTWRRGEKIAPHGPLPRPPASRPRRVPPRRTGDLLHPVLVGAAEAFGSGRKIEQDFLKPGQRRLADVVVSEGMLKDALALFNDLLHGLEQAGGTVMLAPRDWSYVRRAIDEREVPGKLVNKRYPSLWAPSRPTVVFFGTVAIGLTLFELTEAKEARYINGVYLPLGQAERHRPRGGWPHWAWTTQHAFATGRLCLQFYSPYPLADWSQRWMERKPGEMRLRMTSIIGDIAKAAPTIATLVEAGQRAEESRRREWEQERQRLEEQEEVRGREKARLEARQQMLEIIDRWNESQRVLAFFEEAERQAALRGEDEKARLLDRLDQARALIADADVLEALSEWKTPGERRPLRRL